MIILYYHKNIIYHFKTEFQITHDRTRQCFTIFQVRRQQLQRQVTKSSLKKNPNNTLQELYEIIGGYLAELVELDQSSHKATP